MKNILSKVLVVLTVSALFAGNIDAVKPRKGRRPVAPKKMDISKLEFFDLVKDIGEQDFSLWTKEARRDALMDQYGTVEKTPKPLVLFLIGSPANPSQAFRARYKEAALKALAAKAIAEKTKQVNELAKVEDPADPAGQAKLNQETGYLAAMSKAFHAYVPASAITAAKAAIGAAVVTGVVYGGTFAVDAAAAQLGYEDRPGAAFRTYVSTHAGDIADYVKKSYPMVWLGKAYETAKQYPVQAYGAASALGAAVRAKVFGEAAEKQDQQ